MTGGDRTSSAAGGALGGTVTGVAGVTYTATGPGGPFSCTFTTTSCVMTELTQGGTYTVRQVSAPTGNTPAQANYFLTPILGAGPATPPGSITTQAYDTITVTMNGDQTIPVAAVTAANLQSYKAAARGFVEALGGSSTDVTLYTFATTAPAASSSFPGGVSDNATFGPASTATPAGVNALVAHINGLSLVPSPGTQGFTNWDAGMWQMTTTAAVPAPHPPSDEAIVLTDGDPTVHSSTGAPDNTGTVVTRLWNVENGIFSANALKAEGSIFNSAAAAGHPPIGGPVKSEPAHALVTEVKVAPPPEVPVTG